MDLTNLYPFQQELVDLMANRLLTYKGVYNCCEQGLGKTIQALAVSHLHQYKKTLIICPAILRLNWDKEIREWLGEEKWEETLPVLSSRDITHVSSCDYGIVIVSYDLACREEVAKAILNDFIQEDDFLLILDEAHYCKNPEAQRTAIVTQGYADLAHSIIALSGTPMPNHPGELYPVVSCCLDNLSGTGKYKHFSDYDAYLDRYTKRTVTPYGLKFEGGKNLEELHNIIESSIYLRREKSEVLKELPDKLFLHVPVEVSKQHLQQIKELSGQVDIGRVLSVLDGGFAAEEHLASIRRLLGTAIVPSAINYIEYLLETNKNLVSFYHHRDVGDLLEKDLGGRYEIVRVDGRTSPKNKQKAIEDFQSGKVQVFLGQIQAAGVGITLTESNNTVFVEQSWSPADMSQCIDRQHRIGQDKKVVAHYLYIAETIHGAIVKTLIKKQKTIDKVVK